MQLNSIRNMVSKALTDNEISEVAFENILSQTTKTKWNIHEVWRSGFGNW